MTQQGLTNKEAIERLKCLRLFMQINDRDSTNKFLDEDYVANDMAIKALERRICKKPYWREEEGAQGYACPCCDMGVVDDNGIRDIYCHSCGQGLDWSD